MVRIGIDVGGTNVTAGVVDEDRRIVCQVKARTASFPDGRAMVAGMLRLAREAAELAGVAQSEVCAVGVGIPGTVDRKSGSVVKTLNAPLDGTPVRALFQREWDVPVRLHNDACCAVLGEGLAGCGRESGFLMMFTLGTGVGGSYLKKTAHGLELCGTEIEHMVIHAGGAPCPCSRRGCWEQYSSATALKRQTREAMLADRNSIMWALCGGDLDQVRGKTAFLAMEQGDRTAKALCDTYRSDLADGLANAVNIFSPDMICLGGGIAHEKRENLLDPVQRMVEERTKVKQGMNRLRFARAERAGDAGIVGAALLELAE